MSEVKNQNGEQEMELSEILQVRRDKLKALQEAGRDPFQITKFTRSAWSRDILEHYGGGIDVESDASRTAFIGNVPKRIEVAEVD